MDNNVKELLEIVKLADNLGVDVINFQPVLRDNANFMNKELPDSWVKEENIEVLINQLKEVSAYPLKHLKIHNEPNPELLVKYYLGTIRSSDWKCFGGFKTAFICFDKNRPLVYSCHGTCGNLDEISLEKAWKSMEAKKLRYHSRSCTQLCLQSCYSLQSAESLRKLVNSYIRRAH
jgi:MoaA/NifB/PqqE/SkfB family radical SAM enzyme